MSPKLWIALAVVAAFAALLGAAAYQGGQATKFRKLHEGHQACVASITPGARPDLQPKLLCDPVTAGHWAASVKAAACDRALLAKPENTYGVQAACSTPVKTVQADRDTNAKNLASKAAELAREKAGRKAALDRAAADAAAQAQRKTQREAADKLAPRDPDGRSVCNADCLRGRTR